jgi:hypothetical protein
MPYTPSGAIGINQPTKKKKTYTDPVKKKYIGKN